MDTSGIPPDDIKVKFETLRTMDQASDSMDTIENHMSEHVSLDFLHCVHGTITDRPKFLISQYWTNIFIQKKVLAKIS